MYPETLQPTRTDLFGGLTHSRTCRLNATLVLPSLPEYNECHLDKDRSLLPLPRGTSVVRTYMELIPNNRSNLFHICCSPVMKALELL